MCTAITNLVTNRRQHQNNLFCYNIAVENKKKNNNGMIQNIDRNKSYYEESMDKIAALWENVTKRTRKTIILRLRKDNILYLK